MTSFNSYFPLECLPVALCQNGHHFLVFHCAFAVAKNLLEITLIYLHFLRRISALINWRWVCLPPPPFSGCLTDFSFTPLLLRIKFHKHFLASGSLRLLTICSFQMMIIIIIIIFNKSALVTHRVHANGEICLSAT